MRNLIFLVFMALAFSLEAQVSTRPKVRFLALGDSYTIGEHVAATARWPVQLIDSLRKKGVACFDPEIIATTGWRTDNLQAAIQAANLSNSYNLVSLLIGVNNFYQGRSVLSYQPEFEALLDKAIELAGGNADHVFVVSIPDYGYTPFGASDQANISAGVNSFNNANRTITERKGVAYFNITDISRLGLLQPDLVASDGLHPSGKMYTLWVQLILDSIIIEDDNVVTATEYAENPADIHIYPNPSVNLMTIENLPGSERNFKIIFRNETGTTALQTGFITETRKAVVSIEDLEPGTYFYQLSGKVGVLKSGKLIKR